MTMTKPKRESRENQQDSSSPLQDDKKQESSAVEIMKKYTVSVNEGERGFSVITNKDITFYDFLREVENLAISKTKASMAYNPNNTEGINKKICRRCGYTRKDTLKEVREWCVEQIEGLKKLQHFPFQNEIDQQQQMDIKASIGTLCQVRNYIDKHFGVAAKEDAGSEQDSMDDG